MQQGDDPPRRRLRRLIERAVALQVEGLQRLLADMLLVVAQVVEDLGRVACDAQARRDDEKAQDEQEPPRAVDRVEIDGAEHLCPERAELVDVVREGLVLAHHGARHGGDADHAQQRDREAHRREQLDCVPQAA